MSEVLYPSAAEMQSCDSATISGGVPSIELMNRAGEAVLNAILSEYGSVKGPVAVLCGPGNNGGDGIVIYRNLCAKGIDCYALICASSKYSEDFLEQLSVIEDTKKCFSVGESEGCPLKLEATSGLLAGTDLVIDCLLGTGQQGDPRGSVLRSLELLRDYCSFNTSTHLVAVDVPTGVSSDTGEVFFENHYDLLVSIQATKRGLTQYPAKSIYKKELVVDIGIEVTTDRVECVGTSSVVADSLSKRNADTHKGNFGEVLCIGGCQDMPGAPVLSSHAALKTGAGFVRLCKKENWEAACWPEIMLVSLPAGKAFSADDLDRVKEKVSQNTVLVVGPGIELSDTSNEFLKGILDLDCRRVLDAGALRYISRLSNQELGPKTVITPHPGEAGLILGKSSQEIQSDRFLAVKELHERTGSVVVLKGASSLIAGKDNTYVCQSGNPYMASPGMGDVLAGVIAAYLARGLAILDAAITGVEIHARAGDRALAEHKSFLRASDLLGHIGEVEFGIIEAN